MLRIEQEIQACSPCTQNNQAILGVLHFCHHIVKQEYDKYHPKQKDKQEQLKFGFKKGGKQ